VVCGNDDGGVFLTLGDAQSKVLIYIDGNGSERWRVPVPGFGREYTYNSMSGTFYLVESDPEKSSARIVGLDSRSGAQTQSFKLPVSIETRRNLILRNGKVTCVPGAESVARLPVFYSTLLTGTNNDINLMYSEASLVADAGNCAPGAAVDLKRVHVASTQHLVVFDIHPDGGTSIQTVEENKSEGPAATTTIAATLPAGEIIPGNADTGEGNFVAVRKAISRWGANTTAKVEAFEYCVSKNRQVLYRMRVPATTSTSNTTLLGEERIAFTSRGNVVIAFDQDTGREKWRWEGKSVNVYPHAALTNGELIVRDGKQYFILRDGKVKGQRDEDFVLFVMKFRVADDE
jgi:outer membrane protein assembly factor BamB